MSGRNGHVGSERVSIELVSPEQGQRWLGRNLRNRPITPGRVAYFEGIIARGEWRLSPDAVMLEDDGGDGKLLNAQHRLTALVNSGQTLPFIVLRGAGIPNQEITDTGQRRTLAHFLAMRGEVHYAALAAGIRALWRYEQDGVPVVRSAQPSPQQGFDVLARHEGIRDSLWVHSRASGMLLGSLCVVLHYVFSQTGWDDAQEDADAFFTKLVSGENLSQGDPILTLRERLLRERSRMGRTSFPELEAGLTIKAWNLWQHGTAVERLQWKAGGAKRENFPRVEQCTIYQGTAQELEVG